MENFWSKLKSPFLVSAPMSGVTDAAFRRMLVRCGKPEVMFTEFVSADGLFLRPEKENKESSFPPTVYRDHKQLFKAADHWGVASDNPLLLNLLYSEEERPIVAQLFTADPGMMEKGAGLIKEMGFDGLDINMGCPDSSIEKQGAGAALINDPALAGKLIRAARRGAGQLSISVKTRIGYRSDCLEEWLSQLLPEELSAITIHARTRQQLYRPSADWSRIAQAVQLKDKLNPSVLLIGNGDVLNREDAYRLAEYSGADGVMIGRALLGDPELFADKINDRNYQTEDDLDVLQRKLGSLKEHLKLFQELFGEYKNFADIKKHFKAYVSGWEGARELRSELMEAKEPQQALNILENKLNDRSV